MIWVAFIRCPTETHYTLKIRRLEGLPRYFARHRILWQNIIPCTLCTMCRMYRACSKHWFQHTVNKQSKILFSEKCIYFLSDEQYLITAIISVLL